MKLGELGEIQDYSVYCYDTELDVTNSDEPPVLLIGYDEMITSSFFGIDRSGNILEYAGEINREPDKTDFHDECRLCGNDITHLHEMYWVQAQMVPYDTVFDEEWRPLKGTCVPVCPGCEKIIYQFANALLEEHSGTILSANL